MYDPKGNSRDRTIARVEFIEHAPPPHLGSIVHRFLHLRTATPLKQDYRFHALPDACTYVVFDQSAPEITGVTRLRASSEELSLGPAFHFVNIRFLPGVWHMDQIPVSYGSVERPYTGLLPLADVNRDLIGQPVSKQIQRLVQFVGTSLGRQRRDGKSSDRTDLQRARRHTQRRGYGRGRNPIATAAATGPQAHHWPGAA
jgi:hypothetical protein